MWNVPGGFLDFNETIYECAIRETAEECLQQIDSKYVHLHKVNSEPIGKRQNVVFTMIAVIRDKRIHDIEASNLPISDEVDQIFWMPIEDVCKYSFINNQKDTIYRLFDLYVKPSFRTWLKRTLYKIVDRI